MIGKSDHSGDIDDFLLNLIVFIFVFINFTQWRIYFYHFFYRLFIFSYSNPSFIHSIYS